MAGDHWPFFFIRDCVTLLPPPPQTITTHSHSIISLLCRHPPELVGRERFDSLVFLTQPSESFLYLSEKALGCLRTGKAAQNKCQEDYFKLAVYNTGRNKHETIYTKTTISHGSEVDVQY